MEDVQESRPAPEVLNKDRTPARKSIFKYAFGTLLVLSSITGWQAFREPPRAIPAAVASVPRETSGVSRHSTLSIDVFQKFISQNSDRMYPRLCEEIVQAAIKYSDKYDLSPILVLAVVQAESQFYPFALSKKNAKGLMQISPDANQQLLIQQGIFKDPSDIFDPDRNIEAGCFLLRRFINDSPDFNSALDKYLGADSVQYKAEIHQVMGKILLLGITEELNKTSQHKIAPILRVEAPPRPLK